MRMLTAKIQLSPRVTISAWCAPGSRTVMDTYVTSDWIGQCVFKSEVEISHFRFPVTTTAELVDHLRSLYVDPNGIVTEGF